MEHMKLKFRAEPKDFAIFAIFCLVLLYFVAIAVLNVASFASDGTFAGLNPFPAFTGEYLAPTMVFFLAALIAVISSVSSYFFDREKGIGIKTGSKDEKGYVRWAKDKEMKTQLKPVNPLLPSADYAGIPIMNNGKEIWVDNGEYHNLIIGSTGSGKTQITVLPLVHLLCKHGESMVVTDPKGEIYEQTAVKLREHGYRIILLNFRDPQKGNAWNPLSLPYTLYREGNADKANELLDDLAMNILYDEKAQNQDPFWEKTSADYFAGLSLALFEDAKEEEINLNSINLMTTVGEERFNASTYIKEYFSYKDQASPAYVNVASTLMAPNETKSSILSVFKQKIKLFSSRENISEMLSHNDFDIKDIGKQKTAVFIVIQDEKKTYHSLVTIFIKQCYETLIDAAQEAGGKLPYRTNFILDEFANMPPLKDVTTMVTAARSRNIRFNFIIQNFSQLYQVYGKENGETIKGNCGNIIYLISSELSALEEISKMCGEVKSKDKEKTASRPLVTVSDLQHLKQWETIVIRTRCLPFKTKLTPNYKMDWGGTYDKATYPQRDKIAISMFDIKKWVTAKNEEKMQAMFGGNPNGGLPKMPGMPSTFNPMGSPFGGMGAPFGGGSIPFGPPSMGGFNPNMPMGLPNMPKNPIFNPTPEAPKGFDVDSVIKRIDAQIAKLEEEERLEQEAQKAQNKEVDKEAVPVGEEIIEDVISEDMNQEMLKVGNKEIKLPEIPKFVKQLEPVAETVEEVLEADPKIDSSVIDVPKKDTTYVTDDQFFDDFFNDEDE